MDLRSLRFLSGHSQQRAAELAGVSPRTWRRWEHGGGCPLAERWLRYECGLMPGWPPGWRLGRGGLWTPRPDWVPASVIEGARWVLCELADGEARDRAWSIAERDQATG